MKNHELAEALLTPFEDGAEKLQKLGIPTEAICMAMRQVADALEREHRRQMPRSPLSIVTCPEG